MPKSLWGRGQHKKVSHGRQELSRGWGACVSSGMWQRWSQKWKWKITPIAETLIGCDQRSILLYNLPLKNPFPHLLMRKVSDKLQWRNSLQNAWPALHRTIKVIQSKPSLKASADSGHMAPWMGPRTETKEIQNEVWKWESNDVNNESGRGSLTVTNVPHKFKIVEVGEATGELQANITCL